ncbi:MAG: hypothetical protein LBI20_03260 [Holosporales bacterium]|jgi:hypothetical protein|nr:hypothetical protein [Holosporales bacterium]
MNVKCPYCGCNYEIRSDVLKDPIGNDKLGYGWWLRCFKCQKKWWLKKSNVEIAMEKSIKVDRRDKIARISKLSGKRANQAKKIKTVRFINYFLFLALIMAAIIVFYHRDVFTGYLMDRAKRLSKNTYKDITMNDVQYNVLQSADGHGFRVSVTGIIKNENNSITKLQGVKITVFDGQNEVKSWNAALQCGYVVPKDSLHFSTEDTIEKMPDDMRVEVSVF